VADVLEALRGYVQLATGLTEVTVAKAREVVSSLVNQGLEMSGATGVPGAEHAAGAAKAAATQVQGLADELVETAHQNRELLVGLVRTEVERAAGRMGYVREEELAAVRKHVSRLEDQLAQVRADVASNAAAAAAAAPAPEPKPRQKKKKVAVAPDTDA